MYLPTFYKIFFEKLVYAGKRFSTFGVPVSFWCKPYRYFSRLGDVPVPLQHDIHRLHSAGTRSAAPHHRGMIDTFADSTAIANIHHK